MMDVYPEDKPKFRTNQIHCRILRITRNPSVHFFVILQVYQQVLNDQGKSLLNSLVASITAEKSALENVQSEKELITICSRINGVGWPSMVA